MWGGRRAGTGRADDHAKSVRGRLTVYNKHTSPLVKYYAAQGNLHSVDGMTDITKVTAAIGRILDRVQA